MDKRVEKNKSANIGEENVVAGRNGVKELLKSGKPIDKIYVQKGIEESFASYIMQAAKKLGVPVSVSDRKRLDELAADHQGVAALLPLREYVSVEDILNSAYEKNEKPFIVIADGISDPQNLGALIRCAECAGAHGIIIPKHNAATITSAVSKSSAGALEHMLVSKVSSIASAIDALKEKNIWVYGLEADGTPYKDAVFDSGTAIVLGSEGNGMSRLVRERCDFVLSIPMYGKVNSLNVSTAAAVVLFRAAEYLKEKNN